MTGFGLFGAITLIATMGVVAVCLILYLRIMSKRHFKCPYCGQRFKASTMKTFFSFNNSADKVLTCPACGKTGTMDFQHDEDYDPNAEESVTPPAEEWSEEAEAMQNEAEYAKSEKKD